MSSLLSIFLTFSQQLQLYHWKTKSYTRHIESGKLYKSIQNLIDKFVEVLQGKLGNRLKYKKITLKLSDRNNNEKTILKLLANFKEFLVKDLEEFLDTFDPKMSNKDLKNIRDEMLSDVNQTLYLFSLK